MGWCVWDSVALGSFVFVYVSYINFSETKNKTACIRLRAIMQSIIAVTKTTM